MEESHAANSNGVMEESRTAWKDVLERVLGFKKMCAKKRVCMGVLTMCVCGIVSVSWRIFTSLIDF